MPVNRVGSLLFTELKVSPGTGARRAGRLHSEQAVKVKAPRATGFSRQLPWDLYCRLF